VADWKDFAVVLSMVLIVIGAMALAASAQSFSLMKGKVVEKGVGVLQFGGKPRITNTVSVLIENDDRVFDIKKGTIVQYPVTERDAGSVVIGSEIEFLVSANSVAIRMLHT
jgi:hypothetical protein